MLVLLRKLGEKIQIGNNIEVTVVDISRNRIRLGINCPTRIPVHREEVYRRIRGLQKSARNSGGGDSRFEVLFA
jgi:carbon storage regulator